MSDILTYTIPKFTLTGVDWTILLIYFLFVVGVGFALKRFMKTSEDFFLSGKSIAAWITGLAFISANLGAQEVIGMGASGAKYGIATSHFYWIGAIPAMIFVGIFMMPFYYGSRARSVPEYLKLRFDEKTRGFNAISFAVMTVFSSGISMYAMGKLLHLLLGWDFNTCVLASAFIVLVYTFLGGLTSAIYNEVIQFFLIVFGFIPLVFLGIYNVGGWEGVKARLAQEGWYRAEVLGEQMNPDALTHSWRFMGDAMANPMGVEWFGLVMGLGFVLSFGYWCTDFLVVQRAMAANSMSAARRTPLIAAIPKMFFPLLVILPGMLAIGIAPMADKLVETRADTTITQQIEQDDPVLAKRLADFNVPSIEDLSVAGGRGLVPPKIMNMKTTDEGIEGEVVYKKKPDGSLLLDKTNKPIVELDYDLVIPMMLRKYFPAGLLGLGLCALMASFMSGMAGNTTAFNTVWTYDIYQSYINKNASDKHYLWMGRCATVGGILLSIAAVYVAVHFNNIMDILQLVFAFVNAPLFATFMLGMFWRRATGHGAFFGLLSGTLAAFLHHGLTLPYGSAAGLKGGFLGMGGTISLHHYHSEMAQNFWTAIFAWSTCFIVTIIISLLTEQKKKPEDLKGLVYSLTPKPKEDGIPWYKQPAYLGGGVLAVTLVLNILFW